MPRTPEDAVEARQALESWLTQKPGASIIVAAIDEQPDGSLDLGMGLSALTGYHIIGLMEALADQALSIADEVPEVKESPEYDRLLRVKQMIAGGDEPQA
jgi:hypothetical protein